MLPVLDSPASFLNCPRHILETGCSGSCTVRLQTPDASDNVGQIVSNIKQRRYTQQTTDITGLS